MILLASTMDGLDLSRSRVMVAAVQSLAFYCFPLLTGLLLHVMRQRDHDFVPAAPTTRTRGDGPQPA